MRNSSRQALQSSSSSSSRENGFFDIWPLFSFLLSFSSFFLSSPLLRYYSYDENERITYEQIIDTGVWLIRAGVGAELRGVGVSDLWGTSTLWTYFFLPGTPLEANIVG